MAIHPPFLHAGYVGLWVVFFLAALVEGRVDAASARWVRPRALAAWSLLTVSGRPPDAWTRTSAPSWSSATGSSCC